MLRKRYKRLLARAKEMKFHVENETNKLVASLGPIDKMVRQTIACADPEALSILDLSRMAAQECERLLKELEKHRKKSFPPIHIVSLGQRSLSDSHLVNLIYSGTPDLGTMHIMDILSDMGDLIVFVSRIHKLAISWKDEQ